MINKSLLYLLPLIDGWSAKADYPINCYSNTIVVGTLIATYSKNSIPHKKGSIINEDDENVSILYFIMDEYLPDYKLLLRGKYSKISEDAKQLILTRTESILTYAHIEAVLYKNKNRKKYLEEKLDIGNIDSYVNEYESKFEKEKEEFKLQEA